MSWRIALRARPSRIETWSWRRLSTYRSHKSTLTIKMSIRWAWPTYSKISSAIMSSSMPSIFPTRSARWSFTIRSSSAQTWASLTVQTLTQSTSTAWSTSTSIQIPCPPTVHQQSQPLDQLPIGTRMPTALLPSSLTVLLVKKPSQLASKLISNRRQEEDLLQQHRKELPQRRLPKW